MPAKNRRRSKTARPSTGGSRPAETVRGTQATGGRDAGAGVGAAREEARRLRREEARRQAEARARRFRRRRMLKRAAIAAAALAVAGLVTFYVVQRQQAKDQVVAVARSVAAAAGCTDVVTQPDLGATHDTNPITYEQNPATSGIHHPAPLPPTVRVYEQPQPEPNAVHNLEHGYVLVYYRAEGPGALPDPVVTSLADIARRESKVIMAPYPDLEEGRALALAAWDQLQQCPPSIMPAQATTLAQSFISRFRGGGKAPEPGAP